MKHKEGARRIVSVAMAVALATMGFTAAAWWAPQWASASETDPDEMGEVSDVIADGEAGTSEAATPEGEDGTDAGMTAKAATLPAEGGENVASSDAAADDATANEGAIDGTEQQYHIAIDYGNTYGGISSAGFEAQLGKTLRQNLQQAQAKVEAEGGYMPLLAGDVVEFGDQYGSHHVLQYWDTPVDIDKVLEASDFTPAAQEEAPAQLTIRAHWTQVPEPWDFDGTLMPYTVENGVLTFDNHPELGEWYQLSVDAKDGITFDNPGGGSEWTMTLDACVLDADDPLFVARPNSGTYFVRGDARGSSTALWITYDLSKSLAYGFASGSGTISRVGGPNTLSINLSSPSVLSLGYASDDVTVISNEQGATLSHVPNGTAGDAWFWSMLQLVTDPISGAEADKATAALKGSVEVSGDVILYDIHLLDFTGSVFAIPDGEQVTVTLPVPASMSLEGLHVFHVADDGTVTDMKATVDAGARTVSFTTTHFSTFALANVVDNTVASLPANGEQAVDGLAATGDATGVVVAGAALCAVAAAGAAVAARKRAQR